MLIFTLNCGSSSIKSMLYRGSSSLWEAKVQWKNNFEEPSLSINSCQGTHSIEPLKETSFKGALEYLISRLTQGKMAPLRSLKDIQACAHRVVHGGDVYTHSVRITKEIKKTLETLSSLAPLHNPPALEGIAILEQFFPDIPHIAVFDTAFHHSLPQKTRVYPGPYRWFEEGIVRYGFHGISFHYCTKRAAELLKLTPDKMILCHLGSGASLCAVKEGKSHDTTMGFTALEGLMMNTRSGTIDPGILLHLLEKKKTSVEELSCELYEQSGLLGLSGISGDLRDILEKSTQGNTRATLALDVYIHRLNTLIGSMLASLQGLDTLVFTAGNGEHSAWLRKKVCENLAFLGLKLDLTKNETLLKKDCLLSSPDSKIQVLVIHTQEALEMVQECEQILS